MHRPHSFPAAAVAGLALFFVACSGETPTSPKPASTPGSGGGSCTTVITLPAGPITTYAGTAISLRAQVATGGVSVPDNSSVNFTTDLGFFNENGLPMISKTTMSGVADVSPGSLTAGTATVRAAFGCASASIQIIFQAPPDSGPYISLVQPNSGTSAGGDTVVISGGHFGTAAAVSSVTFGGAPAQPSTVSDSSITVKTPARTLANPLVPETVDVCVRYYSGVASVCALKAFTYYAINPNQKMAISSLSPTSGPPAGDIPVTILGTNFGSSIATTRVTFCGLPGQILSMNDNNIGVTSPRKVLANPAVSETCDVVVTIDLGRVSQQSAVLPQSFTYIGSGGTGSCGSDPSIFVSSVTPNTGPPDGGTPVTINGGGFPTTVAATSVTFGGASAQVLSSSASSISVVSPRHTLADPLIPEVVDVVVTDLGSPTGRCARFAAGFTYTQQALTPTITSISPTTGPNDAPTRVTIFGNGFQFPEQVFLTGGGCGTQKIEVPLVAPVTINQLVFQTPVAAGAYACLAGAQVDVQVLNPTTGKTASLPAAFKFYSCPTATTASPAVVGNDGGTVVVNGNNFQQPVVATYLPSGSPTVPLTVLSVSSTSVVLQMPPFAQIISGSASCQSIVGTINIVSTGLSCAAPAQVQLTYRPDPPVLLSASPTTLTQDGGGVTVIVNGTGFKVGDPVNVTLTKDGSAVSGTTAIATVTGDGVLTFTAPAIQDSAFNRDNCQTSPPPGVNGTQAVPTRFGIRVTNTKTGCSGDLSGILVYNPRAAIAVCSASLQITTASVSPATLCSPYGTTIVAAGGTPAYFYSLSGAPAWLSINSSTGALSGTPDVLSTPGTGGSYTTSFSVNVLDSASATVSKSYSLIVNDPDGPFSISGPSAAVIPAGPGSIPLSVLPHTSFSPYNWSFSVAPSDPGITLSATTGTSITVNIAGAVPVGTYNFTVQATDSPSCAGATHTATLPITLTRN